MKTVFAETPIWIIRKHIVIIIIFEYHEIKCLVEVIQRRNNFFVILLAMYKVLIFFIR